MNHFADFAEEAGLDGQKKSISELFGKYIIVLNYRKMESKAAKGKTCIQIQFEMDGKRYVTFTNSEVLERQLDKYRDKLPFDGTIERRSNYYTFAGAPQEGKDGRLSEESQY